MLALGFLSLLISPVSRHAFFADFMHFMRAYLNFNACIFRPDYAGVNRLIPVRLRGGNIILKPPRHHVIFAVHDTQRLITGCHVVNNNAKSHNVRQLLKRSVFLLHFAPNRIRRFFPAGNRGLNAVFRHIFFQLSNNLRHNVAALLAQKVQTRHNRIMSVFVQLGKSNFFQFALHFLHTDTLGQRRINVQCFFGNSGPLFGLLQKMQRPHVMQAVSQFNQQHANVFRHCQQQLTKILRLFVVGRFLLNHCQLGQTVHQLRHLIAEQRTNFFNRRIGVFHRIVQQPGDNRRGIKLKLGQNTGNFHRMRIIGVAGSP